MILPIKCINKNCNNAEDDESQIGFIMQLQNEFNNQSEDANPHDSISLYNLLYFLGNFLGSILCSV